MLYISLYIPIQTNFKGRDRMITRIQMRSGGNVWKVGMVGGLIIPRQAVGKESVFIVYLT